MRKYYRHVVLKVSQAYLNDSPRMTAIQFCYYMYTGGGQHKPMAPEIVSAYEDVLHQIHFIHMNTRSQTDVESNLSFLGTDRIPGLMQRQCMETRVMGLWWTPAARESGGMELLMDDPFSTKMFNKVRAGQYLDKGPDEFLSVLVAEACGNRPEYFCSSEWKNTGWPGVDEFRSHVEDKVNAMLKGSECAFHHLAVQSNLAWGQMVRVITPEPIWRAAFPIVPGKMTLTGIVDRIVDTARLPRFHPDRLFEEYGIISHGGITDVVHHPDRFRGCQHKGAQMNVPENMLTFLYPKTERETRPRARRQRRRPRARAHPYAR